MATVDEARATCFGAWAVDYDPWRPTYPDAAVDWLVPSGATRVVEVAAGAGVREIWYRRYSARARCALRALATVDVDVLKRQDFIYDP